MEQTRQNVNVRDFETQPHQPGRGSFCIPRAAYHALMEANASAYEICVYLIFAAHTDGTGMFCTAGTNSLQTYAGMNKAVNGSADRAVKRLLTIHAEKTSLDKKNPGYKNKVDLGPILLTPSNWEIQSGMSVPVAAHERARALYVLPTFDEDLEDRIWFGNELVRGQSGSLPLRDLKNAGDAAAQLLLWLYAINDMELWGGTPPPLTTHERSEGLSMRYDPVGESFPIKGNAEIIRAKRRERQFIVDSRIRENYNEAALENAFNVLEQGGFMYEMTVVFNRDPLLDRYYKRLVPEDAEPLYQLDNRTPQRFHASGEQGLGHITARTAGDLGPSVTRPGGKFDGTYAAIVTQGHPAMIAGTYRLKYRVANARNRSVRDTWKRIHQLDRDAYQKISQVRSANGLPYMRPPWAVSKDEVLDTKWNHNETGIDLYNQTP